MDCLLLFIQPVSIQGLYKVLKWEKNLSKHNIIHIRNQLSEYNTSDIANTYLKVKFKCLNYIETFDKYFENE